MTGNRCASSHRDKAYPPRGMRRETAVIPVVYFVAIGIGNEVKIGFSNNLDLRLRSFRTAAADVEILLSIPGDRSLEKKLHGLFSKENIAREIFRRRGKVQDFIDHVNFGGLERGLQFLERATLRRRAARIGEVRHERMIAARLSRAEKDAYFASLVSERKRRLGW